MKILYIGNVLSEHGFTPTNIETLGPLLEGEGYDVTYSSTYKNLLLRFTDMFISIIKNSKNTDVVLIDTYTGLAFYYAFMTSVLCKILNLKYIPILHGGGFPLRIKNSPKMTSYFLNNSFKNIVISGYLEKSLEEKGISNVQLIPNNIELNLYKFKHRKKLRPNLLWVRAFHEIYNAPLALKLVHKLKEDFPDVKLTMVGPDKDGTMEICKNLSKELNIDKNVNFTGKLSKEDWRNLAQDHDIFINTTNVDNLPVSVIEALALGLVTISTNVGGIPFLIEDNINGFLVNPDSLDEMYKKIILVLENDEISERISLTARNSVQKFDWANIREDWDLLLKDINKK